MADGAMEKQNQDAVRDYRRQIVEKGRITTSRNIAMKLIIFGIQLTKFIIKSTHESIHGGL
ncbi:unnamed protein product [Prunus armeniaca]|uniref:Uncharacterized protein n=1 Tax=Prunus armeniaca TaxID=36596 RepID=A0A6J5VPL6_PRUAR|nr:unnamed protein product [Prunus armeniaca]